MGKKFFLLFFVFLILCGCSDRVELEKARKQYNAGELEKASQMLIPLAEKGNAEAQLILANMLYEGIGVKENPKKAFEYFSKSANQNYPPAQFLLSQIYFNGEIVESNKKLGFMWLEKAAQNGFSMAQYIIAVKYYEGVDVDINYQKALYWAEKASKQNYAEAQYLIGVMYIDGSGVKQNTKKGFKYIVLSAANGYNFAQIVLGVISIMGGDEEDAKRWFDKVKLNSKQEISYLDGKIIFKKSPRLDEFKTTLNTMRKDLQQKEPQKYDNVPKDILSICNYVACLVKVIKVDQKIQDSTVGVGEQGVPGKGKD